MDFIWNTLKTPNVVIGALLIALVFAVLFYIFAKVVGRVVPIVLLGISAFVTFLGFLFNILAVMIVGTALAIIVTVLSLFVNIGDVRKFLANPFKIKSAKAANFGVEKIFDRAELYKTIESTVKSLSMSRTGAIITFEKDIALKDLMKNGTPIHAPVSQELLQTIFYNGTRLHDGAVIIHGNEIVAAAVFFTPTTKPFAVKYGSRHRAALGISEVSDAVTVIVSEETGRISIAVNGDLEIVSPDNFLRVFENYMGYSKNEA